MAQVASQTRDAGAARWAVCFDGESQYFSVPGVARGAQAASVWAKIDHPTLQPSYGRETFLLDLAASREGTISSRQVAAVTRLPCVVDEFERQRFDFFFYFFVGVCAPACGSRLLRRPLW